MKFGRHFSYFILAAFAMLMTTSFARAETFFGEAKQLGNGFAQLYAELDGKGVPQVLGITFSEKMLNGLPNKPNTYSRCFDKNGNGKVDPHGECNGDYELAFQLQGKLAKRTKTAFNWVSVNWNPEGHPHPAPPPWFKIAGGRFGNITSRATGAVRAIPGRHIRTYTEWKGSRNRQ